MKSTIAGMEAERIDRAWERILARENTAAQITCLADVGALFSAWPSRACSLVLLDADSDAEARECFDKLLELTPRPIVVFASFAALGGSAPNESARASSNQAMTRRFLEMMRQEGPRAFEDLPDRETKLTLTSELSLDVRHCVLVHTDRETSLTRGETLLLLYLMSEREHWRSTATISRDVFQRSDPAGLNLAYKYISMTRRKLAPHEELVARCRTKGYRLQI